MQEADKQRRHDEHFMKMAKGEAEMSKDRSTKVGCVIVKDNITVASGYNGFPRGIYDSGEDLEPKLKAREWAVDSRIPEEKRKAAKDEIEARHDRPAKYKWTEHAERNAIFNNARVGGPSLLGSTAYVPWYPCVDCTRALIQVGVSTMVAYEPDFNDPRWGEDFRISKRMLAESGVVVRFLKP